MILPPPQFPKFQKQTLMYFGRKHVENETSRLH